MRRRCRSDVGSLQGWAAAEHVEEPCPLASRRLQETRVPFVEERTHLDPERLKIAEPLIECRQSFAHQGTDLPARRDAGLSTAQG